MEVTKWLKPSISVNPGWTFGNLIVNDQNSSAPDTEQDIVAADSYGRQLGRVIDALVELIEERPNWKQQPALKELVALHAKRTDQIKVRGAPLRPHCGRPRRAEEERQV
jgi:hypothetical protein